MKLCLVCSAGGHFMGLYILKEFWQDYEHFWVTLTGPDTTSLLVKEEVYWGYSPTNRSLKNLIKNTFFALRVLAKEKPHFIISTGAGIAIPFIYVAKLYGIKTIYIESLSRVNDLSLSGKIIYPVVDHFLVKWENLVKRYRKVRFEGAGV